MAQSGSRAGGVPRAGFNQSGGGYFLIVSSIAPNLIVNVQASGTGSGGAYVAPTLSSLYGPTTSGSWASTITSGKVIRDMGKTIVSSSRAFRKFQAVIAQSASTGGVTGATPASGVAGDAGYLTGYLEVPYQGTNTVNQVVPLAFFN